MRREGLESKRRSRFIFSRFKAFMNACKGRQAICTSCNTRWNIVDTFRTLVFKGRASENVLRAAGIKGRNTENSLRVFFLRSKITVL